MFDTLTERLERVGDRACGPRAASARPTSTRRSARSAPPCSRPTSSWSWSGFVDGSGAASAPRSLSKSLTPGQQVIKTVHDELVEVLGGETLAHLRLAAAHRRPAGRAPGLGQDDHLGQARPLVEAAGAQAAARRRRPAAPRRRRAAPGARPADRRRRLQRADRPGRGARRPARRGPAARRATSSSSTPRGASRSTPADGASCGDIKDAVEPHYTFLVIDAMIGQDAVETAKAFHETPRARRRHPDQARRRRPRRRGPLGEGGRRPADRLRVARARSSTTSSCSTPTAWPTASSAWATCSA